MNQLEFEIQIKKDFENIDQNFFNNVEIYKSFLIEYNRHTNLTRLDKDDRIYGDYFYESIIPYKNINFSKYKKILDIGSGSGIPGIVLKLLYPFIDLTIIESNKKKISFLEQLCNKLNISVELINSRAEEIKPNQREQFDLVTSRAVGELKVICEVSIPYCNLDGIIIEPKSQNYKIEVQNAQGLFERIGAHISKINSFKSVNNIEHNVIYIVKDKITPLCFPRS
jgi:16S rRNA (guanine527-N7)-methyltransferase